MRGPDVGWDGVPAARAPGAAARPVLGREWFRERGRPAGDVLLDDVFASLR